MLLVLKTSLLTRFLGALISFLSSILLGYFLIGNDSVFSGILIVSILIFFTPGEVFGFFFESRLESKYNAIAKSLSFFIGAFLKLILLYNGADIQMLFIAHVIEGVVCFFILFGFFSKKINTPISIIGKTELKLEYSKSLIRQSWPLLVSSIAVILYLKLDQVMILEYLGTKSAGIYGVSVRVCEAIFLIPAIIVPSIFPKMIKLFEENKILYLRLMKKVFIIFGVLSVLIIIILFLTSDIIIPYIFGNEYQESSRVLKIYSTSIPFVFFGHIISKWLIIEQHTKLSIIRHGMGVIVNITLNMLLIPKYGVQGAAFASVMAYFISTIGFMILNKKGRKFIKQLAF